MESLYSKYISTLSLEIFSCFFFLQAHLNDWDMRVACMVSLYSKYIGTLSLENFLVFFFLQAHLNDWDMRVFSGAADSRDGAAHINVLGLGLNAKPYV